jgi:F-type H+-transporting ATPase subunit delta
MRYATAAFDLAAEERAVDKLASDFATLKRLLTTSPELVQLVRSPIISREQQAAGIDAVLKQAGAIELTRKLAQLLTKKRRLFILGDVIASFEKLVARHRGEIAAEVTAARELSEPETTELKRILKDRFGREPQLSMHVDPALLGGIVLRVGSRMIDSSLRSKLEALRVRMRG